MDREQFKGSLQTALQRLPRSVLDDIGGLAKKIIVEHRAAIDAVLPALIAELQPIIAVIGFEKAMGILNTSELEADVMEVLAKFGIRELPVDDKTEKTPIIARRK